jgi:hypothetical protein
MKHRHGTVKWRRSPGTYYISLIIIIIIIIIIIMMMMMMMMMMTTLINKMKKTVYLIDVAIPNTPNLDEKYNEKIQNYLPLAEEMKSVWKLNNVIIVPIIISATGVIPRSLHRSIATLHLDPNIYIVTENRCYEHHHHSTTIPKQKTYM